MAQQSATRSTESIVIAKPLQAVWNEVGRGDSVDLDCLLTRWKFTLDRVELGQGVRFEVLEGCQGRFD
jgi:hypothetical protein